MVFLYVALSFVASLSGMEQKQLRAVAIDKKTVLQFMHVGNCLEQECKKHALCWESSEGLPAYTPIPIRIISQDTMSFIPGTYHYVVRGVDGRAHVF